MDLSCIYVANISNQLRPMILCTSFNRAKFVSTSLSTF